MYNDPTMGDQQSDVTGTGPRDQQFIQGTPVYDVNGDKVGTVSEHGVQHGCLVIHHGLLRDDVYVPLDRIRGSDADGVTLNMSQDEVKALPVNQPPMTEWANADTSPGAYTGTGADTGAAYTDTAADTDRMQQGRQADERAIPLREEERVRLDNQGDVPIERASDQDLGQMGRQP